MDVEVCAHNLKSLKAVLDEHGIRFWLVYGTCLGAVRDGDFIPHDQDTDIAVDMADREAVCALAGEVEAAGFRFLRSDEATQLLTWIRDDEYIDIYFCQKFRRRLLPDFWNCEAHRSPVSFDRLAAVQFLNETFRVPHPTETYLKRMYGADWRTPKAGCPAPYYRSPGMKAHAALVRWVPEPARCAVRVVRRLRL